MNSAFCSMTSLLIFSCRSELSHSERALPQQTVSERSGLKQFLPHITCVSPYSDSLAWKRTYVFSI
jgi:hypothetical protein